MKSSTSNWCFDPDDRTQFFHEFRAENVRLSLDKRLASRQGSFRGLIFSSIPLKPNFPFVVKIEETEAGWTGNLRIGLTTIDPSTLPLISSRDFIQETFLTSLPKAIQTVTSSYQNDINSGVCVYFKQITPGFVQPYAIINEEHICLQTEPIRFPENKSIYAVFDLFGTSKTIRVLPIKRSVLRLSTVCEQKICKMLKTSADALPLPVPIKENINLRSVKPVAVV